MHLLHRHLDNPVVSVVLLSRSMEIGRVFIANVKDVRFNRQGDENGENAVAFRTAA